MTRSRNFLAFISHPWVRSDLKTCAWVSVVFFAFLFALAGVTK